MTSTIKVNKLEQESGCTATIGGGSGKTVTVDATTVTLGRCGATVSLASGASQTGFGRTGTVDWCTTAKTSPFTATSGKGYFVNTCGGAVTVTLPSSPSAGDIVSIKDYKGTAGTNAITIGRGGSKIAGGTTVCGTINTNNEFVTLVYVDGTQGWLPTDDSSSSITGAFNSITATGGTIATCGNYKTHTFTADGTFTVTANPDNNTVEYLIVAGGGGGGADAGAGGGAGGLRSVYPVPISCGMSVTAGPTAYPIVVGAGGAAGNEPGTPNRGAAGSNSSFNSITSAGGGGGGGNPSSGIDGGSGGGSRKSNPGNTQGSGNTPPVSPPQGNPGGQGTNPGSPGGQTNISGGGGGHGAAGQMGEDAGPNPGAFADGGVGKMFPAAAFGANGESQPDGRWYAGGGGGGAGQPGGVEPPLGNGGKGGGGDGGSAPAPNAPSGKVYGKAGTANTGGGGGGGAEQCTSPNTGRDGGAGGSGIVVIRYKYQ